MSFLLDWELTMKCNLDCDYCPSWLYGGHDNTQRHPPLDECLRTIEFMFEYVDIYMQNKPKGLKYVILNVYGGEALTHPNIVEILQRVRQCYQQYQDRWHLSVTTTTNAIIPLHRLQKLIPLIDEFTVSYHTNNTDQQKQQFRENLIEIKNANRRLKCVVLMHSDPKLFADAENMTQWLSQNNIKQLPRQIDPSAQDFNYNTEQVVWFEKLYKQSLDHAPVKDDLYDLTKTGRACCGGRELCENQQQRRPQKFVSNQFTSWYCSVNHFFLYIKQTTKEVFVNRDCKMNFNGTVGPIGTLDSIEPILAQARDQHRPIIQCAKQRCYCGLCSPKAQDLTTYNTIMRKYEISNPNLLYQTQRPN